MKNRYIHWGNTKFEPERSEEISNRDYWVKPNGGFWASPVDAEFGWIDWCEQEEFREYKNWNHFIFTLKNDANVLHIKSVDDLHNLPRTRPDVADMIYLDFEKMKESGIDAIELHLSMDRELYWSLYGWDCDSILIMNKDVIEVE